MVNRSRPALSSPAMPTSAAPTQARPAQASSSRTRRLTGINEVDSQYLLDFHSKIEQRLSKILLRVGSDLGQAVIKATSDIEKLAYVIDESTLSRLPPMWDIFSDGGHDDDDKDRPVAPSSAPTDGEQITSAIREQPLPARTNSPLTAEEQQIALTFINKVNGTTHTLAEVRNASSSRNNTSSPLEYMKSSTNTSTEAATRSASSQPKSARATANSANRAPLADINAAAILLSLSTASIAQMNVINHSTKAKKTNTVPLTASSKRKTPRKRKANADPEYKDSDYPHHTFLGNGKEPLGTSDPSKRPADVKRDSPPLKRTRVRR